MKPWVVINAQGRQIGRYATDTEASNRHSEQVKLNLVQILYRPRAKRKPGRTFP